MTKVVVALFTDEEAQALSAFLWHEPEYNRDALLSANNALSEAIDERWMDGDELTALVKIASRIIDNRSGNGKANQEQHTYTGSQRYNGRARFLGTSGQTQASGNGAGGRPDSGTDSARNLGPDAWHVSRDTPGR